MFRSLLLKKAVITLLVILTIIFSLSTALKAQVKLPLSPNAASLGQYGEIPVNLYTGKPNIGIPLYTLTCGSLSVPISMSYYVDGFKPTTIAGWVGKNWSLNAGGVITRSVKGRPDYELGSGYYSYGNVCQNLNPSINNLPEDVLGSNPSIFIGSKNDYEPDVFYFNFNGYNGKFLLGNTVAGGIQLYTSPYQDLKITSSSLSLENFTIITPDGTSYIFGGSFYDENRFIETVNNININAWYLKQIVAPNKIDIVNFRYASANPLSDPIAGGYRYKTNIVQLTKEIAGTFYSFHKSFNLWNRYELCNTTSADLEYVGETDRIYLSSIKSISKGKDIEEVTFTTSVAKDLPYWQEEINTSFKTDYRNRKLDRLQVNDLRTKGLIKAYNFSYQEILTQRLTLNSIQEVGRAASNMPPYTFEYNPLPNNLPYLTKDFDYWGYYNHIGAYNGTDNNASILPSRVVDANGTVTNGSERDPNGNVGSVGILNKIIYPTGGYTQFAYEPHDYAQLMQHKPLEPALIEVINANSFKSIAGGVRIKKIISVDGSGRNMVKEYKYIKDYIANRNNSSQSSSGILGNKPQHHYSLIWKCEDIDFYGDHTAYSCHRMDYSNATSFIPMVNTEGSHIGYTEVTELLSDGSFTINKFTCFDSRMDKPASRSDRNGDYARFAAVNSMDNERGKLLSVEMYSSTLKKVSTSAYTYNSNPNRFNEHLWAIEQRRPIPNCTNKLNWMTVTGYEIYTYPYYIESETQRVYNSDDPSNTRYQEKIINYHYNGANHKQLTSSTTIDSKGIEYLTQYRYPPDYFSNPAAGSSGTMKKLTDAHIISPVIEQLNWRNGQLVSGKIIDYDIFSTNGVNNLLPKFEYVTEILQPVIGLNPINQLNTDPANPTSYFKKQKEFQGYVNDKLVQYIDNKRVPVTYIWGYNGQYPVAKIVGSNYNTVKTFINQDVIDNSLLTYNHNDIETELDKIRNGLAGTSALITTYTYTPLVGIASEKNSNGKSIYYEYDGFNRLKLIRDQNGSILKTYQYNYKQ